MSLREITKDLHADAERTIFAWQMVLVYNGIEVAAKGQGMLKNLPDIERAHKIYQDCIELVGPNHNLKWLPETIEYYQYLLALSYSDNKHLVKAHLYCRHMGDLFGGQIIAKKCPGSGKFYQFKDAENLKTAIRAELTDDLGDEARVAFQWAIKIMKALVKDE